MRKIRKTNCIFKWIERNMKKGERIWREKNSLKKAVGKCKEILKRGQFMAEESNRKIQEEEEKERNEKEENKEREKKAVIKKIEGKNRKERRENEQREEKKYNDKKFS